MTQALSANRRTAKKRIVRKPSGRRRGFSGDAFLARLDDQPKPMADAEAEAWFAELEARLPPEPPRNADAILTAYEARYGKEAAEWEREYLGTMGTAALLRLDVLRRAMESVAWGDELR